MENCARQIFFPRRDIPCIFHTRSVSNLTTLYRVNAVLQSHRQAAFFSPRVCSIFRMLSHITARCDNRRKKKRIDNILAGELEQTRFAFPRLATPHFRNCRGREGGIILTQSIYKRRYNFLNKNIFATGIRNGAQLLTV